jgi:hypothetical protein
LDWFIMIRVLLYNVALRVGFMQGMGARCGLMGICECLSFRVALARTNLASLTGTCDVETVIWLRQR